METNLQNKENADAASRFLSFILMDLVDHELLTPNEAERARRIYSEEMKNKGKSEVEERNVAPN